MAGNEKNERSLFIRDYNLAMRDIRHHPDNPRKDLGDLTELTDSIKKNGLFQSITVIPIDKEGKDCTLEDVAYYYVLIGNRRFEAASKIPGMHEISCNIIEGLTKREQISIMLEENMQRSDLTVIEEAEGFQMMLDLGETIESIANKTGFSETTVRRRLNIAKLDTDILRDKVNNKEYQLSLYDLDELNKISDLNKRNELLSNCTNGNELRIKARQAAHKEQMQKIRDKIKEMLIKEGISDKTPKGFQSWEASEKPGTYYRYVVIDKIKLSEDKNAPIEIHFEKYTPTSFIVNLDYSDEIWIVDNNPEYGKKKKPTPEELERQKEQKIIEEKINIIKKLTSNLKILFRGFVDDFIKDAIKKPAHLRNIMLITYLWEKMIKLAVDDSINAETMAQALVDVHNQNWYELEDNEQRKIEKEVLDYDIAKQMLLIIYENIHYTSEPIMYNAAYNELLGKDFIVMIEILEDFDIEVDSDIKKMAEGTHENYN